MKTIHHDPLAASNGHRPTLLCLAVALLLAASSAPADAVGAWKRWEKSFTAIGSYGNAYQDVELQVTFSKSGSPTFKTFAYWDGGQTFRVRAALPATGTWNWSTNCIGCTADTNLHNQSGTVSVTSSASDPNRLYSWGFPRVNTYTRHHLVYDNNERFLWLGDTAWAAPMRATSSQWSSYLSDRSTKGFTVIQIGGAPCWLTGSFQDSSGNSPFIGANTQKWNPPFWNGLASKVQAANQQGFVVVFAGLIEQRHATCSSAYPNTPSVAERYMPLDDAKAFTRNLIGLLHGNAVIFSPGFDTDPRTQSGRDLKQLIIDVGNEARRSTTRHLITNHYGTIPLSRITALQSQSWLDFQLFQSGAGWGGTSAADALSRLTERARTMAQDLYGTSPTKPAINGEAPYDGGPGPFNSANNTRYRVRQTAYLSSFSGAFFYTYGSNGVWDWGAFGPSYTTGMARASSTDMKHLKNALALDWPSLVPEHWRIVNQPSANDKKMVVATSFRRVYAYLPDNDYIELNLSGLSGFGLINWWYDPTTGAYQGATAIQQGSNSRFYRPGGTHSDGQRDWVLLIDSFFK